MSHCQNPDCGKPLEAKRSTKKYCDATCRQQAYRTQNPERTNQRRRAKWGSGGTNKDSRPRIRVPKDISAGLRANFLLSPTKGKASGQKSYRFAPAPRSKLGDSRAADPLPRWIPIKGRGGRWLTPAQKVLNGWIEERRELMRDFPGTWKERWTERNRLARLSVTQPMREPAVNMEPPTIAERLSKLERESTRQRGEIDEVARQVGLRFDHEAVREAVDDFLKDALD